MLVTYIGYSGKYVANFIIMFMKYFSSPDKKGKQG